MWMCTCESVCLNSRCASDEIDKIVKVLSSNLRESMEQIHTLTSRPSSVRTALKASVRDWATSLLIPRPQACCLLGEPPYMAAAICDMAVAPQLSGELGRGAGSAEVAGNKADC